MTKKAGSWINLMVAASLLVSLLTAGLVVNPAIAMQSDGDPTTPVNMGIFSSKGDDAPQAQNTPKASHRLLVQLKMPSLAEWSSASREALRPDGQLDAQSPAA